MALLCNIPGKRAKSLSEELKKKIAENPAYAYLSKPYIVQHAIDEIIEEDLRLGETERKGYTSNNEQGIPDDLIIAKLENAQKGTTVIPVYDKKSGSVNPNAIIHNNLDQYKKDFGDMKADDIILKNDEVGESNDETVVNYHQISEDISSVDARNQNILDFSSFNLKGGEVHISDIRYGIRNKIASAIVNGLEARVALGKTLNGIFLSKATYKMITSLSNKENNYATRLENLFAQRNYTEAKDTAQSTQADIDAFLASTNQLRGRISSRGIQSLSKSLAFSFKNFVESQSTKKNMTPNEFISKFKVVNIFNEIKNEYVRMYGDVNAILNTARSIAQSRFEDLGLVKTDANGNIIRDENGFSIVLDKYKNSADSYIKTVRDQLKRNASVISLDDSFPVLRERALTQLTDMMNLKLKSGIFSEEMEKEIKDDMDEHQIVEDIQDDTYEKYNQAEGNDEEQQKIMDEMQAEIEEAMANSTYSDNFYFDKDAKSFAPLTRKLLKSIPKYIRANNGRYTVERDAFGNVAYLNPGAIQATLYDLIRPAETSDDVLSILRNNVERYPFLHGILEQVENEGMSEKDKNDLLGTLFINFHKSNTMMTKLSVKDGTVKRINLTEPEGYSYLFDKWRKDISEREMTRTLFSNIEQERTDAADSIKNKIRSYTLANYFNGTSLSRSEFENMIDKITFDILKTNEQYDEPSRSLEQDKLKNEIKKRIFHENILDGVQQTFKEANDSNLFDRELRDCLIKIRDDQYIMPRINNIKNSLQEVLNDIGINVESDMLEGMLSGPDIVSEIIDNTTHERSLKRQSAGSYILEQIQQILTRAQKATNADLEGWDRESLEVINNDMISYAKTYYRNIAKMMKEIDNSATEAFCRNGRKTYNIHQNKGYLDEFMDHVKSEMDKYDPEHPNARFNKWFDDEFSQYDQFIKTKDGKGIPTYSIEVLNDLKFNQDFRDKFDCIHLLDYDGTEYAQMKSPHVFASIFNMYDKSTEDGYAYYPVPVEADANSFDFIRMRKHNNWFNGKDLSDDCINKFADVALQEYKRIKAVRNSNSGIDNYAERGKQFCFFPELNTMKVTVEAGKPAILMLDALDKETDPSKINHIIRMCVQKTLRNHIDSEFDAAIGMGAYNEDENHKGLYIMGSSITNAREAIKDLFFRKDDEKVGDQSVNERLIVDLTDFRDGKHKLSEAKNIHISQSLFDKINNGDRFTDQDIASIHDLISAKFGDKAAQIENVLGMKTEDNMKYQSFSRAQLDNWYAQIEITQMLTSDIAFYKNYADFIKRFKEVHSPHSKLDESAKYVSKQNPQWRCEGKPNQKVIYAKTIETPSNTFLRNIEGTDKSVFDKTEDDEIAKQLDTFKKNNSDPKALEDYKAKLLNEKQAIKDAYNSIDWTDGAARRTLSSYRTMLVMAHQWTDEQELVYQKLKLLNSGEKEKLEMLGGLNINDLQVFNRQTKFYLYGQVPVDIKMNDGSIYRIKSPIQHKDSETVFAAALQAFAGKYDARYIALNKWMEQNNIDAMLYDSCVKVGCCDTMDINGIAPISDENVRQNMENGGEGANLDNKVEYYMSKYNEMYAGNKNIVHTVPLKYFGDQTSTGNHLTGKETRAMGTQLERQIQNDIDPEDTFTITGLYDHKRKTLTAEQMKDEYNRTISDICNRNAKRNIKRMGDPVHIAEQMARQTEGSVRYDLDDLSLCKVGADGKLAVPLYESSQIKRAFPLLTSIMKHAVEITTAGGSALNACGDMLREEVQPQFVFDKSGERINHIECLMPINVDEGMARLMKRNQFGLLEYDVDLVAQSLFGKSYVSDEMLQKAGTKGEEPKEETEEETQKNGNRKPKKEKTIQQKRASDIESLKRTRKSQRAEAQKKIDDMTTIIGYRIPSENKYSLWPMKIKGFFDKAEYGNSIICPREFTLITGADHDGDKMFFMQKDISLTDMSMLDKDWKRVKIESSLENHLFDLTYAMLTSKSAIQDFVNPQQFIQHEKMGIFVSLMKNKSQGEVVDALKEWGNQNKVNGKSIFGNGENQIPIDNLVIDGKMFSLFARIPLSALKSIRKSLIQDKSPYLMSQYISQQQANLAGRMDIGIGATNSNLHALLAGTKFRILSKQDIDDMPDTDPKKEMMIQQGYGNGFQFKLNGYTASGFGEERCFSGEKISRTTSATLGASVDTAKNATLPFVNINSATMNVANMLMDLGYNTEEVDAFLSQPVIVDMAKAIMSTDKTKSSKRQINDVVKKYQNMLVDHNIFIEKSENGLGGYENLRIKDNKSYSEMRDFNLDINDMFANLAGPGSRAKDFYLQQVVAANLFNHMLDMSEKLQDTAKSLKKDTKGGNNNPTIGNLLEKLIGDRDNLDTIDNDPSYPFSNDIRHFIDVDFGLELTGDPKKDASIFDRKVKDIQKQHPEKAAYITQAMAGIYTEYNVLKKQFPFMNKNFINMLKEIKEINGGHINAMQINIIIDHMKQAAFTMGDKDGYFTKEVKYGDHPMSQRRYYIEFYPGVIKDYLRGYKQNMMTTQHNLLLDNLKISDTSENVNDIKRKYNIRTQQSIRLNTESKKSKEFKEQIMEAWDDLYHSKSEYNRNLAIGLFKYTVHRYGMDNTSGSLASCIPADMRLIPEYIESVRNVEKLMDDNSLIGQFKEQLVRNLMSNDKFNITRYINDTNEHDTFIQDNKPKDSFSVLPVETEMKRKKVTSPNFNYIDRVEKIQHTNDGKIIFEPRYVFKDRIAYKVNVGTKDIPDYRNVFYKLEKVDDDGITPTYKRIDSLGKMSGIKEYDLADNVEEPRFQLGKDIEDKPITEYIASKRNMSDLISDEYSKYQEALNAAIEQHEKELQDKTSVKMCN